MTYTPATPLRPSTSSRTRRIVSWLGALLLLVVLGSDGRAETVQEIIGTVDGGGHDPGDQVLEYDMITDRPGKDRIIMSVRAYIRQTRRVTEFLAPADLKGTKVLTLSATQIYVYLPSYKKVRRVASHASRQSFMGTTFSQAEQALSRYADHYRGELVEEDAESWTFTLSAFEPEEIPYPRLGLKVHKEMRRSLRIDYFDELDAAEPIKTEERLDYECRGEVCQARRIVMRDHRVPGHQSTIVRTGWVSDAKLPKRRFSVRALSQAR